MAEKLRAHLGYRSFTVIQRVVTGVWRDGFIHAGNLAYMAILAIFPFFIVAGACSRWWKPASGSIWSMRFCG
jgi:membrane protein